MYEYKVRSVLQVVDGDTVDCLIDLGFGIRAAFRFRLVGVDAPELRGAGATAAGAAAREFTRGWLYARSGRLLVRTEKGSPSSLGLGDGAFGRWLARFVDEADGSDLSSALIAAGFDTGRRWEP